MTVLCGIEIELFGTEETEFKVGDTLPIRTYANAYPENMYVFGKTDEAYRVVLVEDGKVVTYSDLSLTDATVALKYVSLNADGDTYTFGTSSELLEFMHYEDVYDTYFRDHLFGSSSKNLLSEAMSDEKRIEVDFVLYKGLYELGERYTDLYFMDSTYRNGLIGDILDVTTRFVGMDVSDESFDVAGKQFLVAMRAFKNALTYHGDGHLADKFAEDVDSYMVWDTENEGRFASRDEILTTLKGLFDQAFDRLSNDSVAKAIEIEIFDMF